MTKIIHNFYLTITTALLMSSTSYGQLTGDTTAVHAEKRLHREEGNPLLQTEKSIGLVPEIQGVRNFFFGLGLSRANFQNRRWGGGGQGTTLSLEYNPFDNVIAPKLNIWATRYSIFLNGNVGLSGIYYISHDKRNFVLRPEIGIGYLKVFLNYGYSFFRDDNIPGLNKHTFTLSYYHTIYPGKNKK